MLPLLFSCGREVWAGQKKRRKEEARGEVRGVCLNLILKLKGAPGQYNNFEEDYCYNLLRSMGFTLDLAKYIDWTFFICKLDK